jgi:hypothetical protein
VRGFAHLCAVSRDYGSAWYHARAPKGGVAVLTRGAHRAWRLRQRKIKQLQRRQEELKTSPKVLRRPPCAFSETTASSAVESPFLPASLCCRSLFPGRRPFTCSPPRFSPQPFNPLILRIPHLRPPPPRPSISPAPWPTIRRVTTTKSICPGATSSGPCLPPCAPRSANTCRLQRTRCCPSSHTAAPPS